MWFCFIYILLWFFTTLLTNRIHAFADGEKQAEEFLLLQVMVALFWPLWLPMLLISIAVKKSVEYIKVRFPSKF